MKKPPVFGIVIWKDIVSSEDEEDYPLCYTYTIGKIEYHSKDKLFFVSSERPMTPGFAFKGYSAKIPKVNVELIIPLKIDLPNIPDNLPVDLITLLRDNRLLNPPQCLQK